MQKLNFPDFSFRLQIINSKTYIWDIIRRKFVLLQPEEWVRQHAVQYLINEKNYPASLINVEKKLTIEHINKRYDIVVFTPNAQPFLVVECKAPQVAITQKTFDQIARYNLSLKADFLMVTNGINHYFCQLDYHNGRYVFLKELPYYTTKKAV